MHSDVVPKPSPAEPPTAWYSYAIVRVVPRVERGECINVGVVLFAPTQRFLDARIELDVGRLKALAPEVDVDLIQRHLRTFEAICAGRAEGGPVAALPASDRFHWLTAPRSTVIQTSPVHVGCTRAPEATLDELVRELVHAPAP
jgi:Protein of unknown function (DUF3037)